jgi:hypothetical protein
MWSHFIVLGTPFFNLFAGVVTTTNLARSNHSLVLRALFGGAKKSTFVNIFMICPPMAGWWLPTGIKFCL